MSDRVSEWVSEENCNLGKSSGALQEGVESEKATTSLRCWLVYAGMEMEGWSGKEGVICYRYGFFHFEMPPLSFPFHFFSFPFFPFFPVFSSIPFACFEAFHGVPSDIGGLSTNRRNHQLADLRFV